MEERVDVYDASRRRTGRVRRRGEAMKPGEYGLVVCVWVCDGAGHLLLTKRAPEKKILSQHLGKLRRFRLGR